MWSLTPRRYAAAVKPLTPWQAIDERSSRRFAADFIPIVIVVVLYFLARGLAPDRPAFAVRVAWRLVQFEEVIGIFQEERLQDAFGEQRWVRETANVIYAYAHFPALVGMALALWLRERRRFFLVRNAMYVSMAIGLVCYYALPTAPPRLLAAYGHDVGFIDTVHGGDTFVRYDQPWFFVNDFAAMPSYHFGWMLLTSMALWPLSPRLAARTTLIAAPVIMVWASAVTANHFFVDMVAGGAAVGLSWWLAERLTAGQRS
jgi:hypothetical protein